MNNAEQKLAAAKAELENATLAYKSELAKTKLNYQEVFNFGLRTNIDFTGETRTDSVVFNENTLHETELATASFGQGFNVTMIQMIAGYAALVNGGYYYEPHVVNRILTSGGSVVKNIEPRVVKQVISETTSAKIREYCNAVVTDGTGWRAKPAGYQVGGKTGTAETVPRGNGEYVVSFMCHAPADDHEIICYVVVDRPNVSVQEDAKYATIISQFITFSLNTWYITRLNSISLTRNIFTFDLHYIGKIAGLGVSSLINQISIVAVIAVSNNLLAKY